MTRSESGDDYEYTTTTTSLIVTSGEDSSQVTTPLLELDNPRRTYRSFLTDHNDLYSLNVYQLRSIAKQLGISSPMRKDSIIQALLAHESQDWRYLREIITGRHRKKGSLLQSNSKCKITKDDPNFDDSEDFCDKRPRLEYDDRIIDPKLVFQDLPIFSDHTFPQIFSSTFKKLTSNSSASLPDVSKIQSVTLKRRVPIAKRSYSKPVKVTTATPITVSGTLSCVTTATTTTTTTTTTTAITSTKPVVELVQFQASVIADYFLTAASTTTISPSRADTYVTYSTLKPISSFNCFKSQEEEEEEFKIEF